jgi:hypothetical protein
VSKFKEIFEGNNSVRGVMTMGAPAKAGEKQSVICRMPSAPVTDQMWEDHLEGKEPSLGIVPINEENLCRWGCIDIDVYDNLSHVSLIKNIKTKGYPLVTFRSKSGGAHLFLFATEFIPAITMQSKLEEIAEDLGFGGVEVFPKQTELLTERGDKGSFLNLPYHGGDMSTRYTFGSDGQAASLESFYSIYDENVQTLEQIENIKIKKAPKQEEAFPDGPPCLNRLATEGFGEGSRNNALYSIGVYRKKSSPDNWKVLLDQDNQKYMKPALPSTEVVALAKSLENKDYKYKCKDAPLKPVCDSRKCSRCPFGVGYEDSDLQLPEFKDLTKICSDPPQYFLNVDNKRVKFSGEQLLDPRLFKLEVYKQVNIAIPKMPSMEKWISKYIVPLSEPGVIREIKALESMTPSHQLKEYLFEFTRNMSEGKELDDIANNVSYTDEAAGLTYFLARDFTDFLKRNSWREGKTETSNLLATLDIFKEEKRKEIGSSSRLVIVIKAFKSLKIKSSNVNYDNSPF